MWVRRTACKERGKVLFVENVLYENGEGDKSADARGKFRRNNSGLIF